MKARTRYLICCLGALLLEAPLFPEVPDRGPPPHFSPEPRQTPNGLVWFRLDETQGEIARLMGPPLMAAEYGADYVSWQYRLGGVDGHDYSHNLVFRRSTGKLVSVTRAYDPDRILDHLFPNSATTFHQGPEEASPAFGIRLRRLPGNRVLMAMGVSRAGQPSSQLVLTTRDELRLLYPWLDPILVT